MTSGADIHVTDRTLTAALVNHLVIARRAPWEATARSVNRHASLRAVTVQVDCRLLRKRFRPAYPEKFRVTRMRISDLRVESQRGAVLRELFADVSTL